MDCGFVGWYIEWVNFLRNNKEDIKWRSQRAAKFKNGDHWIWVPSTKDGILNARGCAWSRVKVPRRIDREMYELLCVGAARYCKEIEWYGDYGYNF